LRQGKQKMNKILILFGHPALKRSTINAALRKAVENLEGITFHFSMQAIPLLSFKPCVKKG